MPEKTKGYQPLNEDSFAQYCNSYGLQCSFAEEIVFIKTNLSQWRIYHNGIIVEKLYHSSFITGGIMKSQKSGRLKYAEGFHEQKIPRDVGDNIYDVLQYIIRHEQYKSSVRTKLPPQKNKP